MLPVLIKYTIFCVLVYMLIIYLIRPFLLAVVVFFLIEAIEYYARRNPSK